MKHWTEVLLDVTEHITMQGVAQSQATLGNWSPEFYRIQCEKIREEYEKKKAAGR